MDEKCSHPCPEEQVRCVEEYDQYIPPLWVMCLESVAHLLVMLNFSTNFLVYCSVSKQFKIALSKICRFFCQASPASQRGGLFIRASK